MILKSWIKSENRWEFWDGLERISYRRKINEDNGERNLGIFLVFRDEKKEPLEIFVIDQKDQEPSAAYILNDEGKTIERIN